MLWKAMPHNPTLPNPLPPHLPVEYEVQQQRLSSNWLCPGQQPVLSASQQIQQNVRQDSARLSQHTLLISSP